MLLQNQPKSSTFAPSRSRARPLETHTVGDRIGSSVFSQAIESYLSTK